MGELRQGRLLRRARAVLQAIHVRIPPPLFIVRAELRYSTSALPKPVDILVTGSVPAGSGLSSSAAMVVASTLAFLAVNDQLAGPDGHTLTKGELVEMAVENEKRVGVNSGG